MQTPEPQKEHHWLQKFVGEWTFEAECSMGPDQPPMKNKGQQIVRSLGGLWVISEGSSEIPDGGTCDTIMTLGYDPLAQRFVGTFIASVMTHFWLYNGTLDATGNILTLDTEGPDFTTNDGTMVRYQDIIEFLDEDYHTLSSQVLGAGGQWQPFMKAHYRRKK